MKNAMSSLVAGAFGLGNLSGTMAGGIFATLLKPEGCMVYLTEDGDAPDYHATPQKTQMALSTDLYVNNWELMDSSVVSTTDYDKLFTGVDL